MKGYNEYYKEPNYFGNPYPQLIAYFSSLSREKRVLDIGCGQGRDSLAIGRLGFSVVGIDASSVGIEQMNQAAKEEGLNVTGKVADFNSLDNFSDYDIILLDSMFHFYKKDIEKETKLLKSFISKLKPGSIIIVAIQESKQRVSHLKSIFNDNKFRCKIEYEEGFMFKEFKSRFHIMSYKKIR